MTEQLALDGLTIAHDVVGEALSDRDRSALLHSCRDFCGPAVGGLHKVTDEEAKYFNAR